MNIRFEGCPKHGMSSCRLCVTQHDQMRKDQIEVVSLEVECGERGCDYRTPGTEEIVMEKSPDEGNAEDECTIQ